MENMFLMTQLVLWTGQQALQVQAGFLKPGSNSCCTCFAVYQCPVEETYSSQEDTPIHCPIYMVPIWIHTIKFSNLRIQASEFKTKYTARCVNYATYVESMRVGSIQTKHLHESPIHPLSETPSKWHITATQLSRQLSTKSNPQSGQPHDVSSKYSATRRTRGRSSDL